MNKDTYHIISYNGYHISKATSNQYKCIEKTHFLCKITMATTTAVIVEMSMIMTTAVTYPGTEDDVFSNDCPATRRKQSTMCVLGEVYNYAKLTIKFAIRLRVNDNNRHAWNRLLHTCILPVLEIICKKSIRFGEIKPYIDTVVMVIRILC